MSNKIGRHNDVALLGMYSKMFTDVARGAGR